jgi:hypothetical protein
MIINLKSRQRTHRPQSLLGCAGELIESGAIWYNA